MSGEPNKPLSLICVDWGTTNLRAYAVANDGTVVEHVENNQGLRSNPDSYSDCLEAVIHGWIDDAGRLHVFVLGMVGGGGGWEKGPPKSPPAFGPTFPVYWYSCTSTTFATFPADLLNISNVSKYYNERRKT